MRGGPWTWGPCFVYVRGKSWQVQIKSTSDHNGDKFILAFRLQYKTLSSTLCQKTAQHHWRSRISESTTGWFRLSKQILLHFLSVEFHNSAEFIFKRQRPNCVLDSIKLSTPTTDDEINWWVTNPPISIFCSQGTFLYPNSRSMESYGMCTNLFTEEFLKTYLKGVRAGNWTKTPIQFPETESIFPTLFGNLIDGSQNAVWRFALEGKVPKNYENRGSKVSLLVQYNILCVDYKSALHQIKAELKFKQFAFLASGKVQPRRIK